MEEAHALSELVQAEIWLAQQQTGKAEALLTRFVAQYPDGFSNEPSLDARVMLAQALFAQHKVNQARRVLSVVIQQSASEGFVRPFLDYGRPLIPLLALMLHAPNLAVEAERFIGQVLQLLGYRGGAAHALPANLESLETAASITAREQDVLRLVSIGLSNGEIARRLCVSTGTVKTHLAHIFTKLSVNSRTQAVVEAQGLKLI
jgi:LuxR family maltose regulon positive regulatory protein